MVTRTINYIQDPGHGWFSVSRKDIATLGIADKISAFSFIDSTRVYLEEDGDASIFIKSAEKAGWKLTIKQSHTNKQSYVRSKAGYCKMFFDHPIQVGLQLELYDNCIVTVECVETNGWLVARKTGRINRLPKSNPYKYIKNIVG